MLASLIGSRRLVTGMGPVAFGLIRPAFLPILFSLIFIGCSAHAAPAKLAVILSTQVGCGSGEFQKILSSFQGAIEQENANANSDRSKGSFVFREMHCDPPHAAAAVNDAIAKDQADLVFIWSTISLPLLGAKAILDNNPGVVGILFRTASIERATKAAREVVNAWIDSTKEDRRFSDKERKEFIENRFFERMQ